MHIRPSNSPHVIAVTHPPQSTPSASENCMLKWLNRAGTRSESFGLCWFAPATTIHRAMMDAVKGLQPREERATWSWSWSRSRHGTLKCSSSYSSPRNNSRYLCLTTSAPLKPKRHQSSESCRSHNSTKIEVLDNEVRPLSRMHLAQLNQSPTIPAAARRHNQRQREARLPPCPNQWYTSPPRCQLDGFAEMLWCPNSLTFAILRDCLNQKLISLTPLSSTRISLQQSQDEA